MPAESYAYWALAALAFSMASDEALFLERFCGSWENLSVLGLADGGFLSVYACVCVYACD